MKKQLLFLSLLILATNLTKAQSISFTSAELTTAQIGSTITVDYKYTITADGYIYCAIELLDDWTWSANVASSELDPAIAGTDVTGTFTLTIPGDTEPTANLTGNLNYKIKIELKQDRDTWLAGDYPSTQINLTSASLGIDDISKAENTIKIYPNPVNEMLNIIGLNDTSSTIKIMTLLSEVVYDNTNTLKTNNINISNFSPGLYILSVRDGNNISTIRFIKR